MNPNEIRAARQDLGLSQQKLAALVGCSQPTISLVERGRLDPDAQLMRKIAGILDSDSPDRTDATASVESYLSELSQMSERLTIPPLQGLPAGLSIQQWQQPDFGGDLAVTYVRRKGSDWTVSVVAVDLAGSGPRLMQASAYFRGWIRGLIDAQPQQARGLIQKLSDECRRLEISASAAVIILSGDNRRKGVDIDIINAAFPSVLLIDEPPMRITPPGTIGPALPLRDNEFFDVEQLHIESGTLLITTDGLLERLGAGDQVTGRRRLVKHMTSPARHVEIGEWLSTEIPSRDDELGIVVTYRPWDIDDTFSVRDDYSRQHVMRRLRDLLQSAVLLPSSEGQARQAESAMTAVAEAIDNVREHARGSGIVTIRAVESAEQIRVEIQDDGIGPPPTRDVNQKSSGFEVMRTVADHLYVDEAGPVGSLIGLVFNKSQVIDS